MEGLSRQVTSKRLLIPLNKMAKCIDSSLYSCPPFQVGNVSTRSTQLRRLCARLFRRLSRCSNHVLEIISSIGSCIIQVYCKITYKISVIDWSRILKNQKQIEEISLKSGTTQKSRKTSTELPLQLHTLVDNPNTERWQMFRPFFWWLWKMAHFQR